MILLISKESVCQEFKSGKKGKILIWVMKVKVQRAVLKFKKTPSLSYFEGSVEFGYGINSVKLLSALPGGECYVSIQILAYPYFYASYARVTKF